MKRILFLAIVFFLAFQAMSQTKGISGRVTDSTGEKGLDKATVKLIEKEKPKDTVATTTNDKGEFSFEKIPSSAYSLIITYSGYKPMNKNFFKPTAGVANIDLGDLILAADFKQMDEIVIESPAVTMKEDTVEYRAGAFQTKPNASTEELLKKLPGVTVDRQGNITAHGKQVTKVKVNGKDFFSGDPKTATQEIPADMVDKVQVVDDYGDQANASGIRDGEPEKVINLQLKKDKNKGMFGRTMVGYGTDDRYVAAAAINKFNNNQQLSLIVNSNNNNTSTFRSSDGGGGSFGGQGNTQSGITKLHSGGLNFRSDFGKRNSFYGSYTYSDRNTLTESVTSANQTAKSILTNSEQSSTRKGGTHRAFANLELWVDSFNYIKINPSFSYSETNSSTFSASNVFNTKIKTSADSNRTTSTATSPNFSTSVLYNHRFHKRGRNLSFRSELNLSGNESNQFRNNLTHFYNFDGFNIRDTLQLRNTIQDNKNSGINARLTYTEPIATNRFLDLSYNLNRSFAGNDKKVYAKTPTSGNAYAFIDSLSNDFDNNFNYDRISFAVRTINKKYNYAIGAIFQPVTLKRYNVSKDSNYSPIKNFNWFPIARFVYNFSRTKTVNFNYNGSARQPAFDQLQPVPDDGQLLRKTTGNPNLQPSTSHNFNTSFNNFNFSSGRIFLVNLSYNFINDQIVNKVTNYKDSTGRYSGATLTKPVNIDGYYNTNLFFNFGKPFKNRKYVINTRTMLNYNNNVSVFNDIKQFKNYSIVEADTINYAHNWIWNQAFDFEYNLNWLETRTSASYNLNYTDNSARNNISRLHSITLSNDGRIDFGKGFILRWDFDYYIYKGLSASVQKNIAMLNGSLEKEIFKKKNGILKLSGYDILKQYSNISRSVSGDNITDTRTNGLTQYFMFSFSYRFNKFKGQLPSQNNFRRTDGGGMRMRDGEGG